MEPALGTCSPRRPSIMWSVQRNSSPHQKACYTSSITTAAIEWPSRWPAKCLKQREIKVQTMFVDDDVAVQDST